MDIEDIWQNSSASDKTLNNMFQQKNINSLHSKLPLRKLKNNLMMGIIWALLITVAYIILIFFIHFWQVYFALGVLIIFNIWIMLESWKLYSKIPSTITPSNSLKQELKNNYISFQKWFSLQLKVSLFVYPIAAAGGFIIGGVWGSGKTVEAFLYNARMLTIMAITVLILMAVSYYVAKWLFVHSYGKYLKKIKYLIEELG